MSDAKKPHMLVAATTKWGDVHLTLTCPYTLADRGTRPCLLGIEPEKVCEWDWFQKGEHHKDCPASKDRNATCSGIKGSDLACWPEEPEECDGFESNEIGHAHPIEGCWAIELIGEVGWDEAVRWVKDADLPETIALPMAVDVDCDEDGVTLHPWTDG